LEVPHEPGLLELALNLTGRSFDDQFILLLDCLSREEPEPRNAFQIDLRDPGDIDANVGRAVVDEVFLGYSSPSGLRCRR
jgi:hypothetical protein